MPWVLQPKVQASAHKIRRPTPPYHDEVVSTKVFGHDLRGWRAFDLKQVPDPPADIVEIQGLDVKLLLLFEHKLGDGDARPRLPAPGALKILYQALETFITRSGGADNAKQNHNIYTSEKHAFGEVVGYMPKHQAFVNRHFGFYVDAYKVRWPVDGSETWLRENVENGDAYDRQCTWEPEDCLANVDFSDAREARQCWRRRWLQLARHWLKHGREEEFEDVARIPRVVPATVWWHFERQGAAAMEAARRHIMETMELYERREKNVVVKKADGNVVLCGQRKEWVAFSSRSSGYYIAIKLAELWGGGSFDLPAGEYELLPRRGGLLPDDFHDCTPPAKRRRTTKIEPSKPPLGEGDFGRVLAGYELEEGNRVAVKLVNRGQREAISREVNCLKQLSHPNIVCLFDVREAGAERALIMELMQGDLEAEMASGMLPAKVSHYARDLLEAVCYLHARSLVHCDIKPANLFVRPASHTLKLGDFGLAGPIGQVSEGFLYSLWWRPQEVVFGERTKTTAMDMWAAGAVLAGMVGGKHVFASHGTTDYVAAVLRAVGPGRACDLSCFVPNEHLHARFSNLLAFAQRCLAWEPAQRETAEGAARRGTLAL